MPHRLRVRSPARRARKAVYGHVADFNIVYLIPRDVRYTAISVALPGHSLLSSSRLMQKVQNQRYPGMPGVYHCVISLNHFLLAA